jgi:hypothetical protein
MRKIELSCYINFKGNFMDHDHANMEEATWRDYAVFVGIIIFIFLVSLFLERAQNLMGLEILRMFMGVFFLVFAIFKLLDIKGFAVSYMGYDIVAGRFSWYGYIYPFIELLLALGFFLNLPLTNWITLFFMAIGSMGVGRELMRHSNIKCACLGTYVKLPLTTVSLVEDVAMGIMAIVMLVYK